MWGDALLAVKASKAVLSSPRVSGEITCVISHSDERDIPFMATTTSAPSAAECI